MTIRPITALWTDYDYNVWSDEDNKLTLTAYRLKWVDLNGKTDINTDTEVYESITFKLPEDHKEITYLLDVPNPDQHLAQYGLVDYDDWVSEKFLHQAHRETPYRILEFLQALPNYEPRRETFVLEDNLWKLKETA